MNRIALDPHRSRRMGWMRVTAVLAVTLGLTSCLADEDDGAGLIITGNITPDTDCLLQPDAAHLVRGLFDVGVDCQRANGNQPHGYFMALRVENQLIDRGSAQGTRPPVRANPNDVQITSAEVELLHAQGTQRIDFEAVDSRLVNPFSLATTGLIESAQDNTGGIGFVLVSAIPPDYATVLRDDLDLTGESLTVRVRVRGKTSGGTSVRSRLFEYTVDLCEGCRRACISDDAQDQCHRPGSDGAACRVRCD